jgi:hypothetical protein
LAATRTRRRLTWVTAITVASLLLGSGALNALADERGGGGHGHGEQTRTAAQQAPAQDSDRHEVKASEKHEDPQNNDVERKHDDDDDLVTPPARETEEQRPGLGCGDADDHSGAPGNPDKKCMHPHDNDSDAATNGDDHVATAMVDDDQSATTSGDDSGDSD